MTNESVSRRRIVLVTGASGGIGKGIAEAAAREGWHLVLTARGTADIEAYADDWRRRYGVQITALAQDLSLLGGAAALYEAVQARGIAIDCLANNAGIGVYGEFADTALDDELAMLRLNIEAPTVLAKLFLPQLLARGGRLLTSPRWLRSRRARIWPRTTAARPTSACGARASPKNSPRAGSPSPHSVPGRYARSSPSVRTRGAPRCSTAAACRMATKWAARPGRPAWPAAGWWCTAC